VRGEPCHAIQLHPPGSHSIFSSALLQFRDARGRDLPYIAAQKRLRPHPDPLATKDQERASRIRRIDGMRDSITTPLMNIFNAEIIVMRLLLIATLLVVLIAMAL
jgi:hypothetical protein